MRVGKPAGSSQGICRVPPRSSFFHGSSWGLLPALLSSASASTSTPPDMSPSTHLFLLALAAGALAKTNLAGCTSFTTTTVDGTDEPLPTIVWYVPDTLEICSLIDCGGGRAPPKSDTPGCPQYTGTEAVAVDFLQTDPAAPSVVSTPTPTTTTTTQADDGTTASPRPTGPPEEESDSSSTVESESATATTPSSTKTELVVATGPTPSPPTQDPFSTTADPSPTGAADNLRAGPGALLAAGLAAIAAF